MVWRYCHRLLKRGKVTGTIIIEGYGLSETSPVATANPPATTEFSGTIGIPLPLTEVVLLDDDGNEVALGEQGEISIRGPQVMKGYWNRPDETEKVMTKMASSVLAISVSWTHAVTSRS